MPRTLFAMMALTAGLAALAVPGTSARADVTVYTDQSAFNSQLVDSYLETFDTQPTDVFIDSPIPFAGNGFAYDAATLGTAPGFYNVDGGGGDVWLSTNSAGQTIRFTMTGIKPVSAIGGFFFLTEISGSVVVSNLIVGLADGTSEILSNPSPSSFLGFISTTPIAWLEVTPAGGGGGITAPVFATVNNLIVGQPVPEPSALALGVVGLGLMAGVARRRRARAAVQV